ncbi:hypothetical protein ACFLYL_04430 [Chloroflexota bacterium]
MPNVQKPLTKKRFEQLLTKAAQPLPEKKSAPKATGTEGNHLSDGYISDGKLDLSDNICEEEA